MTRSDLAGQDELLENIHADERPSSDEALRVRVERYRDTDALGELYDRHSVVVYSLLLRITGRSATAERLTKRLFVALWRCSARIEGHSLRTWLLVRARKMGLDYVGCGVAVLESARADSDNVQRRRTALELAYFCGLSYRDIAKTMGAPSVAVKGWVRQELGCATALQDSLVVDRPS